MDQESKELIDQMVKDAFAECKSLEQAQALYDTIMAIANGEPVEVQQEAYRRWAAA